MRDGGFGGDAAAVGALAILQDPVHDPRVVQDVVTAHQGQAVQEAFHGDTRPGGSATPARQKLPEGIRGAADLAVDGLGVDVGPLRQAAVVTQKSDLSSISQAHRLRRQETCGIEAFTEQLDGARAEDAQRTQPKEGIVGIHRRRNRRSRRRHRVIINCLYLIADRGTLIIMILTKVLTKACLLIYY